MAEILTDLRVWGAVSKFADDPAGFVLTHWTWGRGALIDEEGPDEWQLAMLRGIGDKVRNGTPILEAVSSGHGIGKSALTAWIIIWFMSTRTQPQVVVTANTATQLNTKTWRELAKWHRLCILKDWFEWTATKFYHKKYPDTWFAMAIPWSIQNSEAFAGTHEKHVLMMFDEASGIPDLIWEVAEGAMTTSGAMWLAFGNPTRSSGRLHEACFGKLRHRWSHHTIDSRTAKMADQKKIAEWIEDYGEDSDFVRVRVRGLPPKAGNNQFIGTELVAAAVARTANLLLSDPIIIGVDVARFGDDSNVVTIRQGRKLRHQIAWRETDLMETSARVAQIIRSTGNVTGIFVDEVGLGAGVVDRLRQLGHPAMGVNSGTISDQPKLYYNRKAQMWDKMREWLKHADIPDNPDLVQGLTSTEYGFDSKSRIQIEKKSDLKARGLSSPDHADSLALTFGYEVSADERFHSGAIATPDVCYDS